MTDAVLGVMRSNHDCRREISHDGDRNRRPRRETSTKDGALEVKLATPKELGGPGGEGTNQEQFFAAGYSACFLSALRLVSRQKKVNLSADTSISATVGIGTRA